MEPININGKKRKIYSVNINYNIRGINFDSREKQHKNVKKYRLRLIF